MNPNPWRGDPSLPFATAPARVLRTFRPRRLEVDHRGPIAMGIVPNRWLGGRTPPSACCIHASARHCFLLPSPLSSQLSRRGKFAPERNKNVAESREQRFGVLAPVSEGPRARLEDLDTEGIRLC